MTCRATQEAVEELETVGEKCLLCGRGSDFHKPFDIYENPPPPGYEHVTKESVEASRKRRRHG